MIELGRILDDQRASRAVQSNLRVVVSVARPQPGSTQRLRTGCMASALHVLNDDGGECLRHLRLRCCGFQGAAPRQRLFETLGWGDE